MPPSGDLQASLLIVGEAPGESEDKIGLQFQGRAGDLLREALSKYGIVNFCLTNAVICRPPKNLTPTRKEINACLPNLLNTISKMPNLKLIVLLGAVALQALTGHKTITRYSGRILRYTNDISILPVIHPAYVLRNQRETKIFFEHISRIKEALTGSLTDESDLGAYHLIETREQWEELYNKLIVSPYFIYDIETNGLILFIGDPLIKCVQFSLVPHEAYVLPLYNNQTLFSWDEIYVQLKKLFNSKRVGKCGHNIKFDNKWMEKVLGIKVNGTIWDTAIVAHLLNENKPHGLKNIAWEISKLGGYEDKLPNTPDKVDGNELFIYGAIDADLGHRLFKIQYPILKEERELYNVFNTLDLPVLNILTQMELKGIKIDPSRLDTCLISVNQYLDKLQHKILLEDSIKSFEKDSKLEFNPNSHTQLKEVLFKYEGLTPIKYTEKTQSPSTDRETLEVLSEESNLCKLLIEYSLYSALRSKSLKELYDYRTSDNRIHTTFTQDITSTYRTSSVEPNLQNVVKGDKDAVGVRNIFIADEGYLLLEADLNQHELRCMAEIAKDLALQEALKGDVHATTTAEVLGKDIALITEDERRTIGKVLNFGLIYNISAYGISRRLKCSEEVAQLYISRFFNKYFKTKEWMNWATNFVKKTGHIKSLTGRCRRFPIWDELDNKSIREAINFPIQSLASDILLYSLIGVYDFLVKNNLKSFLVLEIHDSLILNIHESELDVIPYIQKVILTYFKNFIDFESDIKVDFKIGQSWGDMRTYKLPESSIIERNI